MIKTCIRVGILVLCFMGMGEIWSQNVCQGVPDFMDLTSPCVTCHSGATQNPFLHQGAVPGRHDVLSQAGFDALTGNQLPLLPPGASKAVRLGNSNINAEAEAITYRFTVDPNQTLLDIRFAVVFEDPNHDFSAQPRFVVRILDENGNLIEACAQYDVYAQDQLAGFQTFYGGAFPVRWRPWTGFGLNLVPYVGREIQVQFITYDCDYGAHYGYAYFTAQCIPNELSLQACLGDEITLQAPEGFGSYLWTTGEDSTICKLKIVDDPTEVSCIVTTVSGCQFTLNAYVSDQILPTSDTLFFDTICQGEAYNRNRFNLPAQEIPGKTTHVNVFIQGENCQKKARASLFLYVIQTRFPLIVDICGGENYKENGFSFLSPSIGIHRDTIWHPRPRSCDSAICLELRVSPSFRMPPQIEGPRRPCMNTANQYLAPGVHNFYHLNWILPAGTTVLSDQGQAAIILRFSETAQADSLKLYLRNGCGEGTTGIDVNPRKAYFKMITDSSCTQIPYRKYGFDLPAEDSSNLYTYVQRLKTFEGCDSSATLFLSVYDVPDVELTTDRTVICGADSAHLLAVVSGNAGANRKIHIGDVYCSDNTIIPFADFAKSGKTAQGVVFWVDSEKQHGWIAALKILESGWSTKLTDNVLGIIDRDNEREAMLDTAGYSNTLAMRNTGPIADYPAAWTVDFDHGWYIPACCQVRRFYSAIAHINRTLKALGGDYYATYDDPFSIFGWVLYSSTESTGMETSPAPAKLIYGVDEQGMVKVNGKSLLQKFRPVKSF